MTEPRPLLLRAIDREPVERPPIWFMRQAGRCLPEYRELRAKAGGFLELCMNPATAAEVTLQPMRRFAFDAAIVFADILILPMVMGQELWFEAGEGPRFGPMPSLDQLAGKIETAAGDLSSVGETVRRVRAELEPHRAVIGFVGGPWTVATYMLTGRGGEDARAEARAMAIADPQRVRELVDIIAAASVPYAAMQAAAGAQALQLFESWAEVLPEPDLFERLVIQPHRAIVGGLRALGVTAPIIGFPRGAAPALVRRYAEETGVQVVGLGTDATAELGTTLQRKVTIQGALDPVLLRDGGAALTARVEALLRQWS
ncbi:MAG TPA: uroporphyrinogen decarboxylase family protein, partial [Caulobacteraceae bacterium]|nr:uroporphyrinogen decarboxylase family protein [Caulobacteraceae bacterium]